MKLRVDNRERKLIKLLEVYLVQFNLKNIEIVVEVLDLGDLIICDDDGNDLVIIERKSLNDLASSIKDGRYVEQSMRLSHFSLHNHNIIYLIEGNLSMWTNKYKVQANTLHSAIFSLNYYKGFSVHKTVDITETAEYVLRICDKLNRSKNKVPYFISGEKNGNTKIPNANYVSVIKKVKKDNITPENISEIILSQIPGISAKTSKVIIDKFGSLYQLLEALNTDQKCMDDICFISDKGSRKISKTAIRNIVQYLLYQKSNIIKIDC